MKPCGGVRLAIELNLWLDVELFLPLSADWLDIDETWSRRGDPFVLCLFSIVRRYGAMLISVVGGVALLLQGDFVVASRSSAPCICV